MTYIIIGVVIVIVILCFFSVCVRLAVLNPFKTIYYAVKDFYFYIRHKKKNECPVGKLELYTGLFGRGKTLSLVRQIVTILYKKYNGKKVWSKEHKCFILQRVHVLSNVDLKIPYEKLVSLEQVVNTAEKNIKIEKYKKERVINLVLIDEMSVQLNSREFKKNLNAQMLNTILCCRHYNMSVYGSSQRFSHCDALLRQVTQDVIECKKIWRFQVQHVYDAYELENATNIKDVPYKRRTGFFVRDKDYEAYDTRAVVSNLKKSWESGDMLSEKDILELQCNGGINISTDEPKKGLFSRLKKRL